MPLPPDSPLAALLTQTAQMHASDLHLEAGLPPVVRVHGELKRLEAPPLDAATLLSYIDQMLEPELQKKFLEERDLDTLAVLATGERFRLNVFFEQGGPALAARFIPSTIPTLEDLLAPEAAYDFASLKRGLVLVTGPTGCGKSTLLAAIINQINNTRPAHVITLEDPVEFLHTPKQAIIAQRQLGTDFNTFSSGLKHVLRQDPDVVLVGEMRDLETISTVITLAETGHLVFATLHTNSAPETVDRIVDSFPADQQQQIRLQFSFVLRGIIAKILIPKTDGTRVSAHEVLVNNTAIASLIRESKSNQIQNVLYSSTNEKMNTLDQELQWLLEEGFITMDTATAYARNPSTFSKNGVR
jgi:twitching motility protein PilT